MSLIMLDYLIYFIAFIITIPFFATYIIYKIAKKIHNHNRKAFHTAINWTAILYIAAVTIISTHLFEWQTTGIILLFILCLLTVIILFQWKSDSAIDFAIAFKLLWRICFLLFLFLYICLVLAGVIIRIFY